METREPVDNDKLSDLMLHLKKVIRAPRRDQR